MYIHFRNRVSIIRLWRYNSKFCSNKVAQSGATLKFGRQYSLLFLYKNTLLHLVYLVTVTSGQTCVACAQYSKTAKEIGQLLYILWLSIYKWNNMNESHLIFGIKR